MAAIAVGIAATVTSKQTKKHAASTLLLGKVLAACFFDGLFIFSRSDI